ncbi:MAG: alkylhydroperoxidase, partial [Planctomycetota bacterium]|nr:alkylhydroperoxidase [Planctomycetota bacterium]
EADVEALRAAGLDDGEILEVNQVSASFNYWVRTINGLGIRIGAEKAGLF